MTKQRESNFEALRVIAIMIIIGGHYFSHGAGLGENVLSSVLYYSGMFTRGNLGVAVFLVLSGWFLCSSKFSYGKLLRMCGEILFYSYLAIVLVGLQKPSALSLEAIVTSIFPISSAMNWYAGNFVIAYAFTPFVRKSCMYFHDNPVEYRSFIITGIVAFVVLGFITPVNFIVSDLVWMIFLFYIGDYVRWKYTQYRDPVSKKACLLAIFAVWFVERIYILSNLYLTNVSAKFEFLTPFRGHLTNRYSIGTFLIAIFLVLLFSQMHFSSKVINYLAKPTFGIYLIHDNPYLRDLIWFSWLKTDVYKNGSYQVLHFFVSVAIIFLVCSIVDALRRVTAERIWMRLVNAIIKKIEDRKTSKCSN